MIKEDMLKLNTNDKVKYRNSDDCESEVISNEHHSEILTIRDCLSKEIRIFRYQELIDRGMVKI